MSTPRERAIPLRKRKRARKSAVSERAELLQKFDNARDENGEPPSKKKFCRDEGIEKYTLSNAFRSFKTLGFCFDYGYYFHK